MIVDKEEYIGKVFELPCINEIYKTFDNSTYYKSGIFY
jgi:hypothetical protein